MTQFQIQQVRLLLVLLEQVLGRSHGGWADHDSLAEFRRLCQAAFEQAEDNECRVQVERLQRFAADLFSDHDHHKWDAAPLVGVDALRFRIRGAVASLRARLVALERAKAKQLSAAALG